MNRTERFPLDIGSIRLAVDLSLRDGGYWFYAVLQQGRTICVGHTPGTQGQAIAEARRAAVRAMTTTKGIR